MSGIRPVFIGGCSRSGTTLLSAMLGAHPQCLTTPESKFVFWVYHSCIQDYGHVDLATAIARIEAHWSFKVFDIDIAPAVSELDPDSSYSELIKWIARRYGRRVGNPTPDIWLDHFPDNLVYSTTLYELFPEAKMIHLVRDGRAIAASVMKLDWGPNTINQAADWWMNRVAHGLATELRFGPERVKQVRYESLILNPRETLREICDFLQIEYQSEMVSGRGFTVPDYSQKQHALVGRGLDAARINSWRAELTPRQIEIFESIAGNVLQCLNYTPVYGLKAKEMSRIERMARGLRQFLRRQTMGRIRRRRRIQRAISANSRQAP